MIPGELPDIDFETLVKSLSKNSDPDGYIYVIRSLTTGLIKIGFTTNLPLRFSQHTATYFSEELIMIAYYKSKFSIEKRFHKLHRQYAIGKTEWYHPVDIIEEFVKQAKQFHQIEGGDKFGLVTSENSVKTDMRLLYLKEIQSML